MKRSLPGQRFESIVTMLERQFAHNRNVRIEASKRLKDRDTNGSREYDIIVTYSDHYGDCLTAIECKDLRRPVTIPTIEAFSKKVERMGIHRAVMVSSGGFRDNAVKKAAALNIVCVDFAQVESLSWVKMIETEPQVRSSFGYIGIWIELNEMPQHSLGLYDKRDRPVDRSTVEWILRQILPKEELQTLGDSNGRKEILVSGTGIYLIDSCGNRIEKQDVLIEYELYAERVKNPFEFRKYNIGQKSYETFLSEFQCAGVDIRYMVTKLDGGTMILSTTQLK